MFIGICGGICAGKTSIAQYLVDHHGFKWVSIDSTATQANGRSHEIDDEGLKKGATCSLAETSLFSGMHGHSRRRGCSHPFPTAEALIDFVTKQWRGRWVTTSIDHSSVEVFIRRPFFLLISVDAPLRVRWQRFRKQHDGPSNPSFEDFVDMSDEQLFVPGSGQLSVMAHATLRLLNTSSDLHHLYATLGKVDLLNEDRLRPSWDTYFMALASLAAQRSNCMKRRVGCVLVRDRRVVSTGYNGTPLGLLNCAEGGCGRCNEGMSAGVGLATCLCIHAEENALLEAGRERVREGTVLYCDTCPCLTCSIKIAQVGISEVVYRLEYGMDGKAAEIFREAGVGVRQFIPPAQGLIHLEKMNFLSC